MLACMRACTDLYACAHVRANVLGLCADSRRAGNHRASGTVQAAAASDATAAVLQSRPALALTSFSPRLPHPGRPPSLSPPPTPGLTWRAGSTNKSLPPSIGCLSCAPPSPSTPRHPHLVGPGRAHATRSDLHQARTVGHEVGVEACGSMHTHQHISRRRRAHVARQLGTACAAKHPRKAHCRRPRRRAITAGTNSGGGRGGVWGCLPRTPLVAFFDELLPIEQASGVRRGARRKQHAQRRRRRAAPRAGAAVGGVCACQRRCGDL
eukprot:364735-Chlamydomonas_euryale.AAC.12